MQVAVAEVPRGVELLAQVAPVAAEQEQTTVPLRLLEPLIPVVVVAVVGMAQAKVLVQQAALVLSSSNILSYIMKLFQQV